ncbi:uncharacterized protein TM35_000034850 [Trypanosoma theileri]|uniref:Transmembrane protein n=1 Tax=Trypanosoma theileri TaxID=67003 RepID=A0A1X0P730_9TRYP|nr:uncharacterized protein TM35_000034850 [Trypanosoma theileri]ORC92732.1 hypothetical protein TM35_000034850 [Trypanosoma theileri]
MRRHHFIALFLTPSCCSRSSLLLLPVTMVIPRRFERLPSGRVRLPRKESSLSSTSSSSSSEHGSTGKVFVNTTGMPVGEVEEGRRGFLGFGSRAGRKMPLNPLAALNPEIRDPSEDRSTSRFLLALQQLNGKRRSREQKMTLQLSAEQKHDIVNRYAQTRWYGFLWYPARNITERQFKWWRRFAHLALIVLMLFGLFIALLLYYREMETVLLLSPEDRRDYQHIVSGMRYSEIYHLAMDVLQKEDPLEALPAPARYHLILEAAREKGWHQIDWELEARTRYPYSPLDEMDFIHMFYWGVIYIGSVLTGGGELFSDRFGNLMDVKGEYRRREMEESFVEHGPMLSSSHKSEERG